MKKKLLSIGLCALTLFSLTGCGSRSDYSTDRVELDKSRFCIIKSYKDGYEMYDKETGKMYYTYEVNTDKHTGVTGVIDLRKTYEGWDE